MGSTIHLTDGKTEALRRSLSPVTRLNAQKKRLKAMLSKPTFQIEVQKCCQETGHGIQIEYVALTLKMSGNQCRVKIKESQD